MSDLYIKVATLYSHFPLMEELFFEGSLNADWIHGNVTFE